MARDTLHEAGKDQRCNHHADEMDEDVADEAGPREKSVAARGVVTVGDVDDVAADDAENEPDDDLLGQAQVIPRLRRFFLRVALGRGTHQ